MTVLFDSTEYPNTVDPFSMIELTLSKFRFNLDNATGSAYWLRLLQCSSKITMHTSRQKL